MLLTRFVGVVERKNSFRIRMMVQVKLQEVLITQKGLDTSLLHFFNDDIIFLVIISDPIPVICVSMTTSQCQPHLC